MGVGLRLRTLTRIATESEHVDDATEKKGEKEPGDAVPECFFRTDYPQQDPDYLRFSANFDRINGTMLHN